MDKTTERKTIFPLFIFFMIVNGFCTISRTWLTEKGINPVVLGFGNIILFILSLAVFLIQKKAMGNDNPQAFIRAIMLGTFIKLMVIAIAVTVYLVAAGENKSIYALIGSMVLYIVYTVIDVRIASSLNRKHGGS
ncbi:hypothetical protein BH10BAC2_BH10BAC2_07650 [soil metagenome]